MWGAVRRLGATAGPPTAKAPVFAAHDPYTGQAAVSEGNDVGCGRPSSQGLLLQLEYPGAESLFGQAPEGRRVGVLMV